MTVLLCLSVGTRAEPPGWKAAAAVYRAGQAEEALQMLAALPRAELRDGAHRIFRKGEAGNGPSAQALFALWTEMQVEAFQRAFWNPWVELDLSWPRLVCRWAGSWGDLELNLPYLREGGGPTLLEIVQGYPGRVSPEFMEAWYLLVLAHYQGYWLFHAKDCLEFAPASIRNRPRMLLARGRYFEAAWTIQGGKTRPAREIVPDLGEAERALREALAKMPELVEARLRLGRVLGIRGKTDEALTILAEIRAPVEASTVYLARLFEAEIHDRRGEPARVVAAYEAAIEAFPEGQAARVGLARTVFMQGQRQEARNTILAWPVSSVKTHREPWAEYYYGSEEQNSWYRDRLREVVRQDGLRD